GVQKFAGKVSTMLPVKQVENGASKIISTVKGLFGLGSKAVKPIQVPFTAKGMSAASMQSLYTVHSAAGANAGGQLAGSLTGALSNVNWGNVLANVIKG